MLSSKALDGLEYVLVISDWRTFPLQEPEVFDMLERIERLMEESGTR